MSDIEEPPAKVLKIDNIDGVTRVTEVSHIPDIHKTLADVTALLETEPEGEMTEEVHEEWLSEGILTDDDYNPASQEDDDHTDSQLGSSQDEAPNEDAEHLETSIESETNAQNEDPAKTNDNLETKDNTKSILENEQTENEPNAGDNKGAPESIRITTIMDCTTKILSTRTNADEMNSRKQEIQAEIVEPNIEETMKHLDGITKKDLRTEMMDSLLLKPKINKRNEQIQVKMEVKKEAEDGNDTDDLLRMLEDDGKTKKLTKSVKDVRRVKSRDASSDDDDFVYEGTTVKKLKAAQSVLSKKQPTKAVPEDLDDGDDETDQSADEITTMKKMFGMKKSNVLKNKPKPQNPPISKTPNVVKRPPAKNVVNIINPPTNYKSTPKQNQNKSLPTKSILKNATPQTVAATPQTVAATPRTVAATPRTVAATKIQSSGVKREGGNKISFKPELTTPAPLKTPVKQEVKGVKNEPDEIIDEEEFLDEEQFDLDEDEFGDSDLEDVAKTRQRIMRPEMMDEEVPSDGDSHSEDGSLYDELPSSDSDDMEDWFQLDIRAEKAGDYIPLLGSSAKELLLEEKRRVASRLQTLKQSLTALTDSGKQQAEQLREATMNLAELDDLLKAS